MDKKKLLKRILVIFGIFIVVLIIAFSIFTSLYEEKIGKKIVHEINQNISSELTVQDFELSIFRSFPYLGADLKDVQLTDNKKGVLLEAQTISFRIGLFSLIKGDITAKSLLIEDGAVTVEISKRGKANYDIFYEGDAEENKVESNSDISIKKAILKNMELIYSDASAKQEFMVTVDHLELAGQFSSKQFSLTSNADFVSNFIEQDGERFLGGKAVHYEAKVFVDMEKSLFKLEKVRLELESNIFDVKGSIQQKEKSTSYDLIFTGEEVSLKSISEMLPSTYLKKLGNLKSRGDILVTATIKGESSKRKNPEIIADLSLKSGQVSTNKMKGKLKDVSFDIHFDNGRKKKNSTSILSIKNFKGYYNTEFLEFDFEVRDLDDPKIDFKMDGVIPMQIVHGFINDDRISDGTGEIEISDLKLKGKYRYMINMSKISKIDMGGAIEFDNASLTVKKEELTLDGGRLIFKDNKIKVAKLKFEGAGSNIRLDGTVKNFIPVLFSDSLNSNRSNLEFDLKLAASSLDIDRLMNLSLASTATKEVKADSLLKVRVEKQEKITDYLKGKFRATINEFNYNKIHGKNFVGNIEFDKKEMIIDGRAEAMAGLIKVDGKMSFKDTPHLRTKIICRNLDSKEFFIQTNNFGQEVLTDKHVEGQLNTRIVIESFWDEAGTFLTDKLHILAEINIKDGVFENGNLLKDLSKIVKVKDLRRIQFSEMENFLEVKNSRIIIPVMYIQNNAMNLTFSGEHSFDNDIEYYLKVNAGRAIIDKFKVHNPSLRPKKSSNNGLFNIYLKFTGNLDNIKYATSKRDVKKEFEYSELRKKRIRKKLHRAFNDEDIDALALGASITGKTPPLPPKNSNSNNQDDEEEEDEEENGFLEWEKEGGN